uniref:PHD-type domain-containing protein n=1 Tax=Rhabditophanes sp. KR3021 TaxID=114890 RepID=A0AC35TR56_9BILA
MPKMKEMVSGCCVCAEEVGWVDNPLIYCDGPQCDVAVHQGCYGILEVPESDWFCSKCKSALVKVKESYPAQTEKDWQEKNEPSTDQLLNSPKCELCPHKYGALKKTNSNMWAHVICALYIPEVRMEPVILRDVPLSRYTQNCCLCNLPTTADASDSDSTSPTHKRAKITSKVNGACMPCNRQGCTRNFHVTCAQLCGLLCEEGGESKNVKYCGYCTRHLKDAKQDDQIKMIPSYIPPGTTLADHGIIVRRKNKDVETSNSEDSSSDSNSTRSDGSSPDNVNTHESNSSTTIKTESALIKEEPQQCHNHFLRQDGLSDNNSTRSDKDRLNKTNGSFISTKQENGYATTKEESLRIKANEMINNIVKGVKNVKYRNEMNIISNSKYDSPLTINASLSSFFSNSAQSSAHSSPKIVNTSISHLHNSHDSCSTAASSPLDALLTAAEMDKKNSLAYMNPHVSSIGHHNISVLTNNNVNGHKNNGHNNNGHNINGHSINEHYNNEHNNGHTNNGGVGTLAITNSIHLPRTIALSKQQLLNQAKLASSALNSPSSISNNSEYDSIELIIDGETFSDYGVVSSSSNIVKAKPNLKRKSTDARYPNGHEEKKRKNGPETNGSVMREVNNSSHPQGPPTSKGSKKSRTAKADYAMSRDLSSSMKDLKSILYAEIALALLLVFPWIRPTTWKKLFNSRLISSLTSHATVASYCSIVVLFLLFLDAARETNKYAGADINGVAGGRGTAETDAVLHMRLFRSQRNLYISGFALILFLVNKRIVSLLTRSANLEAASQAALKQAEGASKAARTLMEAQDGEAEQKLEEELTKVKKDRDAMKAQAENLSAEYDRVTELLKKYEDSESVSDKKRD